MISVTITVIIVIGALAVGLLVGWAIAQRGQSTARERTGNAEGQVVNLQRQLDTASAELGQIRHSFQDQQASLARAQAERDGAFQHAQAAEGRSKEAEANRADLASKLADAERRTAEKDGTLNVAHNQAKHLQEQIDERTRMADGLQAQLNETRGQVRELQEERVALRERIGTLEALNSRKDQELLAQKQWIEEQTQHLQSVFAKTAGELLEDKATKFGQRNKEQIEVLMKPFQDQLGEFRKRVDELHTADTSARARLEQQVSNLAQKAADVGTTANNLANAMLGNAKKQGNWGELQLSVLLEQAGFLKGKHFDTQVAAVGEDNEQRYADTVLWLPEKECLVIDSKLTLPSWVDYCSNEDPEARKGALAGIVASLRSHYQDLAGKDYAQLVSKGKSVPFTLMFIPIEAAGIEAFRAAPDLFTEAQKRKVIMVTPTTLFCVLQLVSALWNIHDRQVNSLRIAEEGRLLLRKLGTFVQSFKSVGDSLGNALVSYEDAKGQLQSGKGNLISIAERMSKLGVEAPKGNELARLIESAETSPEEAQPLILASHSTTLNGS